MISLSSFAPYSPHTLLISLLHLFYLYSTYISVVFVFSLWSWWVTCSCSYLISPSSLSSIFSTLLLLLQKPHLQGLHVLKIMHKNTPHVTFQLACCCICRYISVFHDVVYSSKRAIGQVFQRISLCWHLHQLFCLFLTPLLVRIFSFIDIYKACSV